MKGFPVYPVALTAAFATLDVAGKIDWPWWLITLPLFIGIGITMLAALALALPDSKKD